MEIGRFDWDEANEAHIARHGVRPDEVEEVLLGPCFVRRSYSGRYVALGQSLGGRYLMVVFEQERIQGVRVVTARAMDAKERNIYRRTMS